MIQSIYQLLVFKKRNYPLSPIKIFNLLLSSQYWSREKMRIYQLERLNELLKISYESSNYYKKVFRNVDLPIKSIEEYKRMIPPIDKITIINNSEGIRTKLYTNYFKHASSGSTGDPLRIYISGLSEVYRKAGHMSFRSWWGIKDGEKSVLIMRVDSSVTRNPIKKIKKYFRKRYDLNVFDLNESNIKRYFLDIEKFKPSYIRGYKSGILEFAELMEKNQLKFNNFKLKVVIVTSEVLLEEERIIIERVLDCRVANEYGSAENGFIAFECPVGKMHIYEEANYVFNNVDNKVIITDLFNNSMPLINYENNDKIIISDEYCECGRTSRLVEKIEGRVTNYILKPDGTKLNEYILMVIFYELYTKDKHNKAIEKFKIYQNGLDFLIKIIPLENYNESCEKFIRKRMYEEIGKEIKIKFEIVEIIEREKSGKLTYFVRKEVL